VIDFRGKFIAFDTSRAGFCDPVSLRKGASPRRLLTYALGRGVEEPPGHSQDRVPDSKGTPGRISVARRSQGLEMGPFKRPHFWTAREVSIRGRRWPPPGQRDWGSSGPRLIRRV
jgi:hypothetical protein